jgi:hypothetical protein
MVMVDSPWYVNNYSGLVGRAENNFLSQLSTLQGARVIVVQVTHFVLLCQIISQNKLV